MRATLAVALVAVAVARCRTPPPLPPTAEPPRDPVEQRIAAEPVPRPPPKEHEKKIEPARKAPPPERDFNAEQRELVARYQKKKALSTLRGEASYYGKAFAGNKTASGEVFEPDSFTAAHRTLPFGTVLRVTRLETKESVYVRVNDRGPFGKKRRIIDLSEAAAAELGMLRVGVCEVRVEVLERGKKK